jgi:hypothetical protein
MVDPLNEEIDVIETEGDSETEYGPEVGDPNYWIEEDGERYDGGVESAESGFVDFSEYGDEVFGLEAGDYEMDAVELQRTLSAMSDRSYMAPAEDGGVVLFAQDSFCYIDVNDVDLEASRAEVTVRKGELDESILEPGEPVSQGFFERVKDEVDVGEEERERQRLRQAN